ncbi:MAG: hypothetical protein CME64_14500 [Halobacteriovoraceae bacterium]|nr:hypothetical protein [Halobacteriovoraceae bacterium]
MTDQRPIYYQFGTELKYQVFARIEDEHLERELLPVLDKMGFSRIDAEKLKSIEFSRSETKVLKLSKASLKVSKQILGVSNGMDRFGPESISTQGGYEVYRYQGVGMMIFSQQSPTWEMGVLNPATNTEAVKVMLTRFVSWSLVQKGVVGFWGVSVNEGFVVMKPKDSLFESIFIDINQMAMITQDGVKPIAGNLQILRLDDTLKNATRQMSKEGLLSFLCANTTYLSYSGLPTSMRSSLYEVSSFANGVVYPVENFEPRSKVNSPEL